MSMALKQPHRQITQFHWRTSGGSQSISPSTATLGENLPTPRKNLQARCCTVFMQEYSRVPQTDAP